MKVAALFFIVVGTVAGLHVAAAQVEEVVGDLRAEQGGHFSALPPVKAASRRANWPAAVRS